MSRFTEVADRVWVAGYDWFDVNVTVIGGERGLVVVDTHGSELAGREVLSDVRAMGAGEVTTVVNTHEHFDHTFGNAAFRAAYGDLPVLAHEAADIVGAGERIKLAYADQPEDPHTADVLATKIVPADQTFSSVRILDLGDRALELVHPGRGHTAGDIVIRVPDVDVLLAGDLVEQAGDGVPGFGDDCYPLEWPLTLDLMIGLTTPTTQIIPGHGTVVDREFVERQRDAIGVFAETVRDLAGRGIRVDDALTAGEWPFPADHLAAGVRRIYAQLPNSQKRLPLI